VGERYAELYSLSVKPDLRGRGIASGLLDLLDEELARRSIHDLKVAVMEGTPTPGDYTSVAESVQPS
jgi:ribosomal protein S18 acetylase RimI-like enzyme